MLSERSIVVSRETVRRWAIKFGSDDARRNEKRPRAMTCVILTRVGHEGAKEEL
jgi:transposase-like protein